MDDFRIWAVVLLIAGALFGVYLTIETLKVLFISLVVLWIAGPLLALMCVEKKGGVNIGVATVIFCGTSILLFAIGLSFIFRS